ncbi:MAG: cyclic nucleotide-binding domain-containing protein [Magnetovibrio sp.]|nr:cyclic nucleotide-binding domain-containing protein [Magnetovibrio sp.]
MAMSLARQLTELTAFAQLSADDVEAIAALGKMVRLSPSDVLCDQGHAPDGLYLVLSGSLALVREPNSKNPITVDVLHDGAFFAAKSLFEVSALPYRV